MKTSPTRRPVEETPEPISGPPPAPPGDRLLLFADEAGVPERWMRFDGAEPTGAGAVAEVLPADRPARAALAVPGDQTAFHWLELPAGLSPPQAAGAARLKAAELCAEPLETLHVAVGRVENGLTCVAIVSTARMEAWIEGAATLGIEADPIIPAPLLIHPPGHGLLRRGEDYRGMARAFTIEEEVAPLLARDAPVATLDENAFEVGLAQAIADPTLNLRQGPFARRRRFRIHRGQARRLAALGIVLVLATLALQVATIIRYSFAADRLEAEAAEIVRGTGGGRLAALRGAGAGYAAISGALFGAVDATANAELVEMDYRPDGTLRATLQADSAATLAALRDRIQATGFAVEADEIQLGARPTAELEVRPQ